MRPSPHIPDAHLHPPPPQFRKSFRIRLCSAQGLELVFSALLRGAFLFQSRTSLLDVHSCSRHRWTIPLLALGTACRHSFFRSLSCVFSFHFLLPRLGRHLFLRQ